VAPEPCERGRFLELDLRGAAAWRREVDGAAGVVLAEARRRDHAQDLVDCLAARELALEDRELVRGRAKAETSWISTPSRAAASIMRA
jgi:hypothetical protein